GRVDGEVDVRRIMERRHLHEGGILPALLAALVHLIERRALTVSLMVVEGGGDARDRREEVGMTKSQAQGALAAHADAAQADVPRANVPALREKRDDAFQQIALRADVRVELGAEAIRPPGMLTMRTDAGEVQFTEQRRENRTIDERLQTVP